MEHPIVVYKWIRLIRCINLEKLQNSLYTICVKQYGKVIYTCICLHMCKIAWGRYTKANNSSFSIRGIKTWQMGDSGGR